jgi:CheY-like chemotaxis protein
MVLAAVHDVLLRARIQTIARQAHIEVAFARSSDDILATARTRHPVLIVIDLTESTISLLATIATLKSDPVLAATRIIASTDAPLADAARRAGADEVLPAAVFAAHVAQFLEAAV